MDKKKDIEDREMFNQNFPNAMQNLDQLLETAKLECQVKKQEIKNIQCEIDNSIESLKNFTKLKEDAEFKTDFNETAEILNDLKGSLQSMESGIETAQDKIKTITTTILDIKVR